jgi:hypothetical protein
MLAACGSSTGPAGPSSHDTPAGAVRGLINALAAGDTKGAQEWIAPSDVSEFTTALDEAKQLSLTLTFDVSRFSVVSSSIDPGDGNRALVRYAGKAEACVKGTANGRNVDSCNPIQSQTGQAAADTFVCVRQNGAWYVSISSKSS